MSFLLSNVGLKIAISDSKWRFTRHKLGVGDTFKSHNREERILILVDVRMGVPEGLSDTGDTHKTILSATDSESGYFVVVL